jgi:VCBS repeat-containing protein
LNGLSFTPTANFSGAALLTLTTDDQGNTGAGGAKNDSDSVSINVTAVNDAPVATADSDSITEDAAGASGNVLANDTDIDATPLPDTLTVTQVNGAPGNVGTALGGSYGALTLNADGSYSYALDNALTAVQALKPGDTLTDSFVYQISDGNGGTDTSSLTITINGANDIAVIGGSAAGSVAEDSAAPNLLVTDALTVSDADTGESGFVAQPGTAGNYGTFTVDTAGNWSYTAANNQAAIQQLGAGATLSESFTVVATDASASRSVIITITGTNDAPIIGGIATAIVNEDASTPDLAVGGALSITDADAAESGFVAQTATTGTYGTFAIDAAGNWSYTALNSQAAIQQLAAGATLAEAFNVVSADGTVSEPIIITITGINDAPVATGGAVTVTGSTSYVLRASDFGYSDVEGEALTTIRITGRPSTGALTLGGVPVALGQDIAAADIAAGKLEFASSTASAAVVSDTLMFQVNDGKSYSASSYAFTVNLVPVFASDPTATAPIPTPGADSPVPVPAGPSPGTAALPPLATPPAVSSAENPAASEEAATGFEQNSSVNDSAVGITDAAASRQGVQSATSDSSAPENTQSRSATARHVAFQLRPVSFKTTRFGISFAVPASLPMSDAASVPGAAQNTSFVQELDRLRESMKSEIELEHRVVGSAVAVGTALSVGYVIWLLRGGLLVTSLLSSLPAWRYVDPLPVLGRLQGEEDDDDESLESMVSSSHDAQEEDDVHG